MKERLFKIAVVTCICIAILFSFAACAENIQIGDNTEYATQFMENYINNNPEDAYEMLKGTTTYEDFSAFWNLIYPFANGAENYELQQIGWYINTKDGTTSRTSAYRVTLDNGNVLLIRIVTVDGFEGVYHLNFNDITEFTNNTNKYVPIVNGVLWVVTIASYGLTIWMLIDCIRRKIKLKVLWCILMFFGFSLKAAIGESVSTGFMIGLMLNRSKIVADPGTLTVQGLLTIPLGAILYFCLRKRLTIVPPPVEEVCEEVEPESIAVETETENDR